MAASALAAEPEAAGDRPDDAPMVRLLEAFAAMPGLQARFVEEKHLALLSAPLKTEGELYYAKPGLLLRRTTAPTRSEVLVEPGRVSFQSGADGPRESIDLKDQPVVGLFVESFVSILRGDRAALARIFEMRFEAEPEGGWKLELQPKVAPMDELIRRIEVVGKGMVVDAMTIEETSGDRTATRFVKVDTARQYSERERAELFGPRH